MNTRMEKVAEDIALAALRKVGSLTQPPLQPKKLKEAFHAGWPPPDSTRPMNDAMTAAAQAAGSCVGEDADNWKVTVSQAWQPAVEEVVEDYFKAAKHSFEKGEPLDGVEIPHRRREGDAGPHRRRAQLASQYPRRLVQHRRSPG